MPIPFTFFIISFPRSNATSKPLILEAQNQPTKTPKPFFLPLLRSNTREKREAGRRESLPHGTPRCSSPLLPLTEPSIPLRCSLSTEKHLQALPLHSLEVPEMFFFIPEATRAHPWVWAPLFQPKPSHYEERARWVALVAIVFVRVAFCDLLLVLLTLGFR